MPQDDPTDIPGLLRRLAAATPEIARQLNEDRADVREALKEWLGELEDLEILKDLGYYNMNQAMARICDTLQYDPPARIKTFTHCGQEHHFHVLQTYVTCPVCRSYRAKTRGFFGLDEIDTVASLVLNWLRIDHLSVPGWNPGCDPHSGEAR